MTRTLDSPQAAASAHTAPGDSCPVAPLATGSRYCIYLDTRDISTQWCSQLSLAFRVAHHQIIFIEPSAPSPWYPDIDGLYCTVLYCTVLHCPVPGESQLDGFLCWLLPVSPCTVTIHSTTTSLALDYVITLPTTTNTQGAGGDIPSHSCRWWYTTQHKHRPTWHLYSIHP